MDMVKIALMLLGLFLLGSSVGAQEQVCPVLVLTLEHLEDGELPTSFPSLSGCKNLAETNPQLAAALARLLLAEHQDRASLFALADLLEQVKHGYWAGGHQKDFASLGYTLHQELADSEWSSQFALDSAAASYDVLDPLIRDLHDRAKAASTGSDLEALVAIIQRRLRQLPYGEAETLGGWSELLVPISMSLALVLLVALVWRLVRSSRSVSADAVEAQGRGQYAVVGEGGPRGQRRQPADASSTMPSTTVFEERLTQYEQALQSLDEGLKSIGITERKARLAQLESKVEELERGSLAQNPTAEIAMSLPERMTGLEQRMERLSTKVQELVESVSLLHRQWEPASPTHLLEQVRDNEEALLKAAWKRFTFAYPALVEAAAGLSDNAEKSSPWHRLLTELPRALESHESLSTAASEMLVPLREHHQQLQRLAFVPKLVQGDVGSRGELATEIARFRESSYLLAILQNTERGAQVARFRFDEWIRRSFVDFADQLQRAYQQAELEHRVDGLEPALRIALAVLRHADLEPVAIVLGCTPFDPNLHLGRSHARERKLPDGTIAAVVRNGYRDLRTGKLLVQPEVVVNRV